MDIPVYLFTGFLEAGKTKFIQETFEDPRFVGKGNTLLLLCEEGFTEYDESRFADKKVIIEVIEDEEDLTKETLQALAKKHKLEKVVAEFNGMWQLNSFYTAMPKEWIIYQEFLFADATTFENYNANMRSLVVDKLQTCEMVIFNRYNDNIDKMTLHKIVRGISRSAQIAYEYADGSVSYDDIEDPLPFDINADVIKIEDRDFAIWYRDLAEDMKKYNGKTVKFKALVAAGGRMPKGCFAAGRHIMTCCADDISYSGLICDYEKSHTLTSRDWIMLTAKIEIKKHKAYGKEGPVLIPINISATSPAEPEVATFY